MLSGLGGAAVLCPPAARGQDLPVIGFLHSGTPEQNVGRVARFRKGLRAAGFVEGRNLAIEYRWAGGQADRLREMASDLADRKVKLIATLSSTPAAVAAHASSRTIPLLFLIAEPPVELGLVQSLSRPGGHATGFVTMSLELSPKRLEILRELTPEARLAVLYHRSHPGTRLVSALVKARADALGVALQEEHADTDAEIEAAFSGLATGTSLLVATSPFFFVRRQMLASLAARRRIPAIYDNPEYPQAGGLMSYGAKIENLWEEAGTLASRILKGEQPADLPVVQASSYELIINAGAARELGLTIPLALVARAEEVIE